MVIPLLNALITNIYFFFHQHSPHPFTLHPVSCFARIKSVAERPLISRTDTGVVNCHIVVSSDI